MRSSRWLHVCVVCLVSVILFSVIGAAPALAKSVSYSFVNYSGRSIKSLYITSSGYDKWGSDLLGSSVLNNGDSVDLRYDSNTRYWDIKIVWMDGSSTTWSKNDYKSVWRKTLYRDGNTYYIKSN